MSLPNPAGTLFTPGGELSADLIKQLECFILENAHIPQLSYDARYLAYKSVYTSFGAADFDNSGQRRGTEDNVDAQLAQHDGFPQG